MIAIDGENHPRIKGGVFATLAATLGIASRVARDERAALATPQATVVGMPVNP